MFYSRMEFNTRAGLRIEPIESNFHSCAHAFSKHLSFLEQRRVSEAVG